MLLDEEITLSQAFGFEVEECYAIAQAGYNLLKQGKVKDSLKIFEGLCAICPKDGYFQALLGCAFAKIADYEKAYAAFTLAIEFRHDDVQTYLNRAETLLALDRVKEALEDLQVAVSKDPHSKNAASIKALMLSKGLDCQF